MYHMKNLKIYLDLFLITNGNNSHYVYAKDFNRFIFNKTKQRNKKRFSRYCFQCFSSEKVLVEHVKADLKFHGKRSVKLRNGMIKLNHCKQLSLPFKIYADFESV